ncbi:MAG TPA: hypothetical protein VHJ79_03040, partial [Mycobacterium sp.]|nr:hypothetical protein [Mycobacterium sp.]
SVAVDVGWEGAGPIDTTSNTTTFSGFTGHFVGQERDAVATGTVVVDNDTLVDGSTTNARIETLETSDVANVSSGRRFGLVDHPVREGLDRVVGLAGL